MEDDYEQRLFKWAHKYDGYKRLASDPNTLFALIEPLHREYAQSRTIPEWAGVDLLRGWAFYMARSWRFSGYDGFVEEEPAILAVVDAINRHPAAKGSDRAPER